MKKNLELEVLRGLASLYVFFHHALPAFFGTYFGPFFIFGQEAVMLFFLLSGFVITMSQDKRQYSFKTYFKHRFVRIYSVFGAALVLSYVIFGLLHGEWSIDIFQFLINVFMLQDKPELKPGVFASPIFNNEPLWSLGYEWWFYFIFFIHYIFSVKKSRDSFGLFLFIGFFISLIGIISYKLFYNQISVFFMYYYIWLSGGAVYLVYSDGEAKVGRIFNIFLGYFILLVVYGFLFVYKEKLFHYVDHPLLEIRHYTAGAVMLGFSIFVYEKCYPLLITNKTYNKVMHYLSYLSVISFSLYLVHYPIIKLINTVSLDGIYKISISLIVSILLGYVIEEILYPRLKKRVDEWV